MDYKSKYLKYKAKYLQLKQEAGGSMTKEFSTELKKFSTDFSTEFNKNPIKTTLAVGIGVPLLGTAKGIQAVGRQVKQLLKSDKQINDEINEINRIIKKYGLLTRDLRNEDGKIVVELFLNKIKREIYYNENYGNFNYNKYKDLNYLSEKHFMCKGDGIFVYENNKCFE